MLFPHSVIPYARLALAGWLLVPSLVWAEGDPQRRAVREWNVEVFGGYEFLTSESFPIRAGLASNPRESRGWVFGGALAAPIGQRLGLRVGIRGGQQDFRSVLSVPFPDVYTTEDWFVSPSVDLFWRDPSKGYAELGYAFTRRGSDPETPTFPLLPMLFYLPRPPGQSVHTVRGAAGLFVRNVDLEADVAYSPRTASTASGLRAISSDSEIEEADAGISARWYVTDWLAPSARFAFRYTQSPLYGVVLYPPLLVSEWRQIDGYTYDLTLGVETLLPTRPERPISLVLLGGVGALDSPVTTRGAETGQVVYHIAFRLRMRFPAPESLRAWYREYR